MRRAHRKTRNGCSSCKRRRVKCDERKPSCVNCERNGLSCSLQFLMPAYSLAQVYHRTSTRINHLSPQPSLRSLPLDPISLELLHHYITHTCLSLGTEANMMVWRDFIPQMAISTEFLMQGMLAVSAVHLAHLQPQRRLELLRRASISEHAALPAFRKAVSVQDQKTVHAALAFGGFVVQYVLALSKNEPGKIPKLGDSAPHWFHLIRGLVKLTISTWPSLMGGPFRPLLTYRTYPVIPEDNPEDIHLAQLYNMLGESVPSSHVDEEALATCRVALDELRRVAATPYTARSPLDAMAVVYIWPGTVQEDYIMLLHQRRPEALVILAHYCVLLKKIDSCWYTGGIGRNLLAACEMTLGTEWAPWIQWAVDQPTR